MSGEPTTARWQRRVLRGAELVLGIAGIVGVFYVSMAWVTAEQHQIRAERDLLEMVAAEAPGGARGFPDAGVGRTSPVLGHLSIARVGLSVAIMEGDDDRTLAIAAGHLPDTPLPWQDGNSAISGHRDTFFRPLQDVRVGDEVRLLTPHGDLRYRVLRVAIVEPDDVWVLMPWDGVSLTLLTCYPFTFVGSAPQRFVVHAERVDS